MKAKPKAIPYVPELFYPMVLAQQFEVAGTYPLIIAMDPPLHKAAPLDGEDLAPLGFDMVARYAERWLAGQRDLALERAYPELAPWFFDVRNDDAAAQFYGTPTFVIA